MSEEYNDDMIPEISDTESVAKDILKCNSIAIVTGSGISR